MATIKSYRDLEVWRKGMELATEAYRLSKLMPKGEEYRLISQLLRAAVSIPANVAEGHARGTRKEYAQSVSIARGSLAETETLLLLAVRTRLLSIGEATKAMQLADELGRQLTVLRQRLTAQPPPSPKTEPQKPL